MAAKLITARWATLTSTLLFPLPRPSLHRTIVNARLPRVSSSSPLPSSSLTPSSSSSSSSLSMASEAVAVEKTSGPYGSWKSPITADVVAGAEKRLGGVALGGDGRLLWIETRPGEGGRAVIVKEPEKLEDKPLDVISSEFSARTLAQEYGGGAFAARDNVIIFSNYKDQRLYKQTVGGNHAPVPLTPDYGGPVVRYADGVFDPLFHRFITVMEDHRTSSLNPTTTIVAIHLSNGDIHEPKVLLSGNDFYAFPRLDPSGKRMAWVEWSHPNMHWDKAELWVGYVSESGDLYKRVRVAGGDPLLVESPTEPKWSSKGELFFMTDRRMGFWNIYKWIEDKNEVVPVYSMNAEFARPLWVFGTSSYDFVGRNGENNSIVCSYRQSGRSYLGILDYVSGSFSLLDIPLSDVTNVVAGSDYVYVEGASATHPLSVAKVTLNETLSKATAFSIVWSSSPDVTKHKPYFSLPELIEFPTQVPGQSAYAYFYPPTNPNFQGSPDEKPPLLVKTHGGPTAETRGILDLNIQYWTSRGWAFVDVNYGGSTGYGREYRERLLGQWGVVDVNDCCSCARYLVESGRVDGQRLCITGRSAGGYTTLACLAFRDTFKAGASLYGVADLSLLKAETHKFESHYIDNLVGNERDYFEKSPINFVDKFTCPVILFQGLDDKIVPPDQAREIYKALKEKGLPVALVEYEGEQHGFRKAENIKFTLEQAMMFFARLVGRFEVADDITPIKIDNFD
ncbi:dipeptidyl-peptidase 5-like isoform X1 [Ananas comosus]|uniref:Dipeptidyl-peptidase 5-like isoform X1 n=1 Tax=Ananas comosus TaxID=4615 RepID=A0A6P5F9J5_ANACO|nr:dipeptidyl-peptidase 5-like isoform X1 [Ananas comosus]